MSWGRLFQMWGPKYEKVRKPWVLRWSVGFWTCVCLTKCGEDGKECKGVAAQKDKRERNLWLRCNTCKQFCILFVQKLGASGVAVGEICSFDGVELWEWGVQQYFGLSASVELQRKEKKKKRKQNQLKNSAKHFGTICFAIKSDLNLNCAIGPINKWSCASLVRDQELCQSRGGRPRLPVHNITCSLYGRK